MVDTTLTQDINLVAFFLAAEEVSLADLESIEPVDCVVFCVSAILCQAAALFTAISARKDLTKTLVLCGGIGHSTQYLYNAVALHPQYRSLKGKIDGLPEAQVMARIVDGFFDFSRDGPKVLVEDQSTNCGANAVKTRELLEKHGYSPRTFLIVQDPTMSLRTLASFRKAFESAPSKPTFRACPVFVPSVLTSDGPESFAYQTSKDWDFWAPGRFLNLLLGEIPRLRDDEGGYGPQGKGFIGHVELPESVELAWRRLNEASMVEDLLGSDEAGR